MTGVEYAFVKTTGDDVLAVFPSAVTDSVVPSTAGQAEDFASMGVHELKGAAGEWELHRVRPRNEDA